MSEPAAKPNEPPSAESLVGEIVTRNRESLERQRLAMAVRPRRSWLPYLIPATVILIGLSIWNPGRRREAAVEQSPIQEKAAQVLTLEVGKQLVEAFRDSTGRLPTTLAEATPLPLGLEYTPHENGTYRLVAGAEGNRVVYRSDGPPPDLARVVGPLMEEAVQ